MVNAERTEMIIGACLEVYNNLGNGFLEAVYAEALEKEFALCNIPYTREKEFSLHYKGFKLKKTYKVDFYCYDSIIVELKAVENIIPVHISQLINYLKLSNSETGLLINFGNTSLQYKRRDLSFIGKNKNNS